MRRQRCLLADKSCVIHNVYTRKMQLIVVKSCEWSKISVKTLLHSECVLYFTIRLTQIATKAKYQISSACTSYQVLCHLLECKCKTNVTNSVASTLLADSNCITSVKSDLISMRYQVQGSESSFRVQMHNKWHIFCHINILIIQISTHSSMFITPLHRSQWVWLIPVLYSLNLLSIFFS